ncbi:uncharacterized protein [Solanum lycopersicum]|uniref:uncharacterized protein n=1 Tax=Solanum lycopersicum TaxID=4081 RepID=UPI003748E7DB
MVKDIRIRMSLFVFGLVPTSSKEGRAAMLIGDIDISRLMVYVQQVKEEKVKDRQEYRNNKAKTGNESGQHKGGSSLPQFQISKGHAPSSASTPDHRNRGEYSVHKLQNFKARPTQSQGSVVKGGTKPPSCAKCDSNQSSICHEGSAGCFKWGQTGHFMRESIKSKNNDGNGGNRAHSSSISPIDRATPRGATSGTGGGTYCLYALNNRHEQENSLDVVTGMIRVFDFTAYALLDP